MRTIPVYQILAEDIKGLGVDTVFGLMSDDICQLFATLDAMGVRMVGARHETNAVMAAHGYAAATGKLGIALIGRGPAMANAMHGTISSAKSAIANESSSCLSCIPSTVSVIFSLKERNRWF